MLAVTAAGLLSLAFSPLAFHTYWAPKAAVCLVLLGPGLVALVRLAVAGSRSAVVAGLFLAWAIVATLASENPTMALIGEAGSGTGLVFTAALVGCWALGRETGPGRRRQLAGVIMVSAVASGLVAWLQARGLVPPVLESPGRAAGFTGNPVHLGALCGGALWLIAHRIGRERSSPAWLVALVIVAGGAQLSGGRAAVLLSAAALIVAALRTNLRRGAAILVVAGFGFVVFPIGADGALLGSTRSLGPEAGSEVGLRFDLWGTGLKAATERPLVGWGPGAVRGRDVPQAFRRAGGFRNLELDRRPQLARRICRDDGCGRAAPPGCVVRGRIVAGSWPALRLRSRSRPLSPCRAAICRIGTADPAGPGGCLGYRPIGPDHRGPMVAGGHRDRSTGWPSRRRVLVDG